MAATTEQQMSLTVAPRGSSSLNRPARQLVPAFLQKLYEMVNDPADQDLIRWSDTGDSFFVLDQERFASEVLGRWFKHKNFSSFVRQLNMYGFHKIPHLQQGVLRAESDTEFWNFEHPHFLRGQPDLLCLIQRKKQAAPMGDDPHAVPAAIRDPTGNAAVGPLSANQLLDMNSIVNGIQAIKRHQAAISVDLNELKSSNQHLWQEAMAARERHKKHQDTINRILKFLAGVFGHGDNQMHKDEDAPHAVVARKPQRLLIADGRNEQTAGANEGTQEESRASMESAQSATSADLFGSLDTPPAQPSEPFSTPRFTSVEPSAADAPTPIAMDPPVPQEVRHASSVPPSDPTHAVPLTTSTTTIPTPSQLHNDHIVQAALTAALNSPSQMQKLLAALAAQSISPEVSPGTGPPPLQQHLIAPSPYNDNPQQYTPGIGQGINNTHFNVNTPARLPTPLDYPPANTLSPFTLSLLGDPSDPTPFVLQQQDERLQKTYKTTAEINNDVDELQTNIQSLIQGLGIDPTTLDSAIPPAESDIGGGGGAGSVDMFSTMGAAGQDFDFDSFLMDMPGTNEEDGDLDKLAERLDPSAVVVPNKVSDASKMGSASTEQLHAFLDEVASQDGSEGIGAGVPPLHGHGSQVFKVPTSAAGVASGPVSGAAAPVAGAGSRGRKRKSDAIADGTPTQPYVTGATTTTTTPVGNKSKRKR